MLYLLLVCQIRDIISTSRGERLCPNFQTGATHYHEQLGPPDKGRAIKGLVFCWSMAKINKLYGMVPCCGQDGYRPQVPQRHIDSYNI